MSEPRPIRAFVAIHPPAELSEQLGGLIERMDQRVPPRSVRWVRADSIHLTLRFLGNVPADKVETLNTAVRLSVRGVRSFEVRTGCLGCFPDLQAPRVLWVGLGGALSALADLQARVQEATRVWGEEEAREFHPHLTLGRVNTRRKPELRLIREALEPGDVGNRPGWRVEAVDLMQSVTSPAGSQYTRLASVPLAD